MTRSSLRLGALIWLGVFAAGCSDSAPTTLTCTDEARYGVHIRTFDGVTSGPVTTNGTAVAVDGSYREETSGVSFQRSAMAYNMASERAGRYTLTVTVPGYQVWSKDNVTVKQGTCHVESVSVDAYLAH